MASGTDWSPQQQQVQELVAHLYNSISGDSNVQRNAELMLKQAKSSPDIDNYLAYLLANSDIQSPNDIGSSGLHAARSAAAIMLKNRIKSNYKNIPEQSKSFIRSVAVVGLKDSNAQIRGYTGNVITELIRQAGVMKWPDLLSQLMTMAGNSDGQQSVQAQEGAMNALLKVCQDNKKALCRTYDNQCPLDVLVPQLLTFMSSQSAKVRSNALESLNVFIEDRPGAVSDNLDQICTTVFAIATDSSDEVRKQVCRAVVLIVSIAPEKIAPHMAGLVDYMIDQQQNTNDLELALDAAEFWLCVAEETDLRETLQPYLAKVVPVLLQSMVYSEDDVIRLEGEGEDAEEDDREQDIRPSFATSKAARSTIAANGGANGTILETAFEDESFDEGELEDLDDVANGAGMDEDDPEQSWNLRKCSAAALDVLASMYHDLVFQATLPYLDTNFKHSEWPRREAAVLAIGAIAEGCEEDVQPHLPKLIPFLVDLLQDQEPVVRQITCWSLGRYSSWASHLDDDGRQQFFVPMMDGILKRMLDSNKKVQEAAVSAFANLEEQANKVLENPQYCEVITRQFAECFAKYKDRNMLILYDCVQTLAENVGTTLQKPELINTLMPPILTRWEKVNDMAREMFPLQECLSYLATALGPSFSPYAEPIFARCTKIIYENLEQTLAATQNNAIDMPEKDFQITSLDLLSAIIQALGVESSQTIQIITKIEPNIFDLLVFCLEDSSNEVRQSAYALLGDCAIYVYSSLAPHLPRVLPILMNQLKLPQKPAENDFAVTNNACWSCGEITIRAREAMEPYVNSLLQNFYSLLSNEAAPPSLHENAAIALGRLGNGCAESLSPHLSLIAPPFLNALRSIAWTDEKLTSMEGFSEVVLKNPQGLDQYLMDYIVEIAQADFTAVITRDETRKLFQKVFDTYKQLIPNFTSMVQNLPPQLQQPLQKYYTL